MVTRHIVEIISIMYKHIESPGCTPETERILYVNYTPILKKKKKKNLCGTGQRRGQQPCGRGQEIPPVSVSPAFSPWNKSLGKEHSHPQGTGETHRN